jgi:hypothetical protein
LVRPPQRRVHGFRSVMALYRKYCINTQYYSHACLARFIAFAVPCGRITKGHTLQTIQLIGAILFGLALLHTFAAKSFEVLAPPSPSRRAVSPARRSGSGVRLLGLRADAAIALLNGGRAQSRIAASTPSRCSCSW